MIHKVSLGPKVAIPFITKTEVFVCLVAELAHSNCAFSISKKTHGPELVITSRVASYVLRWFVIELCEDCAKLIMALSLPLFWSQKQRVCQCFQDGEYASDVSWP